VNDPHKEPSDRSIIVAPTHDIFALGLLAFEALSGAKVFGSAHEVATGKALDVTDSIQACACGKQQYPWERPGAQEKHACLRSLLGPVVVQCLHRDASQRPDAKMLCQNIAKLGLQC
jgi:hypothetical protein